MSEAFALIAARLPDADAHNLGYAVAARFSIADAALFYAEFWADKIGLPLSPRCATHYQLMRTRCRSILSMSRP